MKCPNCHHEFEPTPEDEDSEDRNCNSEQLPECNAVNHRLETMGHSCICDLQDQSLHEVKCLTCNKVGWYTQRGRLAEQKGVSVRELTNEEWNNPEKFLANPNPA
jgi:hypothetical protein